MDCNKLKRKMYVAIMSATTVIQLPVKTQVRREV